MNHRHSNFSWDDFPYRTRNNIPLCRYCHKPLKGRKTAWCSKECTYEVLKRIDWTFIRRSILWRDHHRCTLCKKPGNEVDHIIELIDGGSFWEPNNLRTLCHECHRKKTAYQKWLRRLKQRITTVLRKWRNENT